VMFIVGLVPSLLVIPLRFFLPESPRWLAAKGRFKEADQVVKSFEDGAIKSGKTLAEPMVKEINPQGMAKTDWRELFRGIYRKRTFTLWGMWFCVYMVNNAMVTWLPSLYKQHFGLSLQTSLGYGWITSGVGVIASIICALT
ncbi:MFS transporter, partial [Acinetobacter baumannii]